MDTMTATDIMAEVRTVYATCRSYRDTGEVWVNWDPDSSEPHRTFSTAFVRPDRFRFEVVRTGERFLVVHLDAQRVRTRFYFASPTLKQLQTPSAGFGPRTALAMLLPALRCYFWLLDRAIAW